MDRNQQTDVVIVGAGMVGATFASALLRNNASGLRVTMVEPAPVTIDEAPYQPGFDTRSTALSAGTVGWFERLGLWRDMQQQATPIRRIHVSDQGRFGTVRLTSEEAGVDSLGHVVENPWAGLLLNRHLASLTHFTLRDRCRVTAIDRSVTGMKVSIDNEAGVQETLHASLVVMAEGGRSGLATSLGIERETTPYEQTAVIANVVTEQPHNHQAWERFTEKGPLALLPLATRDRQNRHALIWTHPAERAHEIMQSSDEDFLNHLQQDFGYRLGRFLRVGKRQSYPLALVEAREQARPGLVLLGNSAHTLHPVAGQGFNLAFRDALVLAETIRDGVEAGRQPGEAGLLNDYVEQAGDDQWLTVGFSHQLTRLFSSSSTGSRLLRRSGLLAMELLPGPKSLLARQAMGINGRKTQLPV